MFDVLFIILITILTPIIVIAGIKLYKPKTNRKVLIGITLALLALEIARFFANASLYENAATPSSDLKFGYITVLCIVAMFATFNNSKFSNSVLKPVFALTALVPFVYALFYPVCYINPIDVTAGAVCKAFYMVECGLCLTLAILYFTNAEQKFSPLNILWSALTVLVYAGIDAFIIWYWKVPITINYLWFVAYAACLATIALTYLAFYVYNLIKSKQANKHSSENAPTHVEE